MGMTEDKPIHVQERIVSLYCPRSQKVGRETVRPSVVLVSGCTAALSDRRVMRNHHDLPLPLISLPTVISALLIPDAIDFALKPSQIICVTFIVLVNRPLYNT